MNKHQDNIPDGPTYSRTLGTRVNAGRPTIDFAEAIHNNKNVDNIGDGATYSRTIGTRVNAGRPTIDFSEAIHSNQNLDHMPDGTRAAWDSVAMKTAAVDSGGNLKLKNVNDAVGTTSGPTTTSTTYSVIPEMTQTLTFKGNKVLLAFTLSANIQNALGGNLFARFAIFKDGVQLSQDYAIGGGHINDLASSGNYPTLTDQYLVAITFIDSPSAGSHTYDVRWLMTGTGGSMTLLAVGTARRFQIVELG